MAQHAFHCSTALRGAALALVSLLSAGALAQSAEHPNTTPGEKAYMGAPTPGKDVEYVITSSSSTPSGCTSSAAPAATACCARAPPASR